MLSKLVKRKKQQPGPTNATVGIVKPRGFLARLRKNKIARSVSPLDKPPSRKQLLVDRFRALPPRKKLLVAGLTVLLVIALGLAVRWLLNNDKPRDDAPEKVLVSYACSDRKEGSILYEAADALDPADLSKFTRLEGVVAKIKQLDKHENDPNCLYPIIRHHVARADVDEAKSYYEKLVKVYDPDLGFNSIYRMDLDTVKAMVDHLDVIQKEAEANTIYFNGPEEL